MNQLTFTLKTTPTFKLNCSQLTPNCLAGLSLKKIGAIKLGAYHYSPVVADFFDISGEDCSQILFNNASVQLDYIGHKMTTGSLLITGDVGDFLGANMRGGSIICQGNTGNRAGDQMRRGLMLIEGNAGDFTASRMIAGTIGILGTTGSYTGYAMRRGTLILTQTPSLLATIQDCGTHTLPYLSLLFKSFAHINQKFYALANNRVQLFAGDLSVNGTGEILVLKNAPH